MIESPRLLLRRLRPSDERDLIALYSDPHVMKYVGSPAGPRSPEETAVRVRQRIHDDQGPLGFWLVESRIDGGFHGLGALIRMPSGDDIEWAYRLARHSWGQGIATEAAGALLDRAFGTVALPKVVAVTYPENRASQRVLEKLGFAHHMFIDYRGVKAAYYVITREAWGGSA